MDFINSVVVNQKYIMDFRSDVPKKDCSSFCIKTLYAMHTSTLQF